MTTSGRRNVLPQVQALAAAIGSKTAQQVSDYSQYVCEVSFMSPLSRMPACCWCLFVLAFAGYAVVVVLPLSLVALR